MRKGFTLIEILVSLAVLAVLMLAFVRFFGGTLEASGRLQIQNELLAEAQIAHHLIASRVKEAWYVWPPGANLKLASSGWSTANTLDGGRDWTVGPKFLAMILPPQKDGVECSTDKAGCFRFYAYYPMRRSHYTSKASAVEALDPDPANDSKVWVLMEYRSYYRIKGGKSCPVRPDGSPDPSNTGYRGRRGRLLVDYLQPFTDPWDPAYSYTGLFDLKTSGGKVTAVAIHMRFVRHARGRVHRVPAGTDPLSISTVPQNLDVLADASDGTYCR